jgi:hypothetical protein
MDSQASSVNRALVLRRRPRPQGPRSAGFAAGPAQRGPGPLQGALDRDRAGPEHGRRLLGRVAEHVAEYERGRLPRRHPLQPGHEGKFDRLGGLVPGLRARRGVGDALEQRVRVRLEPGDLAAPGRLGRLERRHRAGRDAPPGRAQRVEALVGRDPVQPRAQRGPLLEAGQPPPGGQQRLLQQVLGVGQRPGQPVAVRLQFPPVRLDQRPERLLLACLGALQDGLLHGPQHAISRQRPGERSVLARRGVYLNDDHEKGLSR